MTEKTQVVLIYNRLEQGAGIAILYLRPRAGESLPSFSAGAHIDVHVAPKLIRQYSLSNDPDQPGYYRIGVLNEPCSRGGSKGIYDNFQVGREVQISAPRNHFSVKSHSSPAVLIAGGIGITPILSMAYELRSQQRPFEIHYCLSTSNDGAFVDEICAGFDNELTLHCSDQKKFDPITTFSQCSDQSHLYICGPQGFMDWVIEAAKSRHFPASQIHLEYFNADVESSGLPFEVYCAASDKSVYVAENETIANALSVSGIKVQVSCEQGVCGTCITEVLEGEPDHRDQFLTDEEKDDNDQIALCCSRSRSRRLVIDI